MTRVRLMYSDERMAKRFRAESQILRDERGISNRYFTKLTLDSFTKLDEENKTV